MHEELKARLTAAVDAVVNSESPKKLVVAGPGAGKTFLFRRLLETLDGDADDALVLTFINNLKNDLARDLAGKAQVYMGQNGDRLMADRFTCLNCDNHSSKCFAEPVRSIIQGNAADRDDQLLRYFDPVDPGNAAFQRGDLVLWPTRRHSSLATGQGHEVSQYGYTVEEWKEFTATKSTTLSWAVWYEMFFNNNMADVNAKRIDQHDNVTNADGLSAVNPGLGPYAVYRLKAEYRTETQNYLLCKHLSMVRLSLKWGDNGEMDFRYAEPATYYPAVTFNLSGPPDLEPPVDQEWTASVRSPGTRSHYGCTGFKDITIPADELEQMTADELKARAQQDSDLGFYPSTKG
jgi:hypothetical protein